MSAIIAANLTAEEHVRAVSRVSQGLKVAEILDVSMKGRSYQVFAELCAESPCPFRKLVRLNNSGELCLERQQVGHTKCPVWKLEHESAAVSGGELWLVTKHNESEARTRQNSAS